MLPTCWIQSCLNFRLEWRNPYLFPMVERIYLNYPTPFVEMGGKKRRGECVFLAGSLTQRSWVRILHITSWFRGAVKLHSDKGVRLKGGSRQKREHQILIKIPKILNKYQEVNNILHLPFNFKWNALFGQLGVLWRGSVTRFSTPSWVKKKNSNWAQYEKLHQIREIFLFSRISS